MTTTRSDALLFSDGRDIICERYSGDETFHQFEGTQFIRRSITFRYHRYAAEWLAVCDSAGQVVGIQLDSFQFPELVAWLRRGFPNVFPEEHETFRIMFSPHEHFEVPGWPYLPVESYVSDQNDFLLYVTDFDTNVA